MSKSMVLVASLIFVAGVTVLAQQRSDQGADPGPGSRPSGGRGAMPAYYTNKMMLPGPVAAAATDRACQIKGHTWLACPANLLKADLSPELLAHSRIPAAMLP